MTATRTRATTRASRDEAALAADAGRHPTRRAALRVPLRRREGRDRAADHNVIAFMMGGLVVRATGKNPFAVYHAIFNGTGLNWFLHVGSHSARGRSRRTDVVPVGHASVAAEPPADAPPHDADHPDRARRRIRVPLRHVQHRWSGPVLRRHDLRGLARRVVLAHDPFVHVTSSPDRGRRSPVPSTPASPASCKATVGAHEVISTIMLNWIAIWVGSYLFGQGGPLQNSTQASIPISNDIVEERSCPSSGGLKLLQGLSIGIFIAVFDARRLLDHRQPHDARLRGARGRLQPGGGAVRRHLGGAELLPRDGDLRRLRRPRGRGRRHRLGVPGRRRQRHPGDQIGFIGLAAALLGRNTAVGVGFASLLFGALITGTSGRQLDPTIFRPDLAGNLTTHHPGPRRALRRRRPRRPSGVGSARAAKAAA